jgi:hypothetical protein
MDTDSRDELPSAATTSRPENSRCGPSFPPAVSWALTPVMRPVRSSSSGPVTLTPSMTRAPAFSACRARAWSKSSRVRTSP